MNLRKSARYLLPPFALDLARDARRRLLRRPPAWAYVPEGWRAARSDPRIKGWNQDSIVDVYRARWPALTRLLDSPLPLAVALEHPAPLTLDSEPYSDLHLVMHNVVMSYAYALGLAAHQRQSLSVLDWGGGIGHYYPISRALFPDVTFEYHCRDLAAAVAYGQEVLPDVHFHGDDGCLARRYDLVSASGSFHYSEDWCALLARLGEAAAGYLYIAQLPVVLHTPSYVMVQRPYGHGYNTEYLGWCLNRSEFLGAAEQRGMQLRREFIAGFRPDIHGAPERAEYRSYLFGADP
jgi:putative methyltransferase (TIGR04325 family)